jgi:RNA polymerase-binding transcription factor DksA
MATRAEAQRQGNILTVLAQHEEIDQLLDENRALRRDIDRYRAALENGRVCRRCGTLILCPNCKGR